MKHPVRQMAKIENKGPDISGSIGLRVTANTCVASLTQVKDCQRSQESYGF
jgi:hypothetical protein